MPGVAATALPRAGFLHALWDFPVCLSNPPTCSRPSEQSCSMCGAGTPLSIPASPCGPTQPYNHTRIHMHLPDPAGHAACPPPPLPPAYTICHQGFPHTQLPAPHAPGWPRSTSEAAARPVDAAPTAAAAGRDASSSAGPLGPHSRRAASAAAASRCLEASQRGLSGPSSMPGGERGCAMDGTNGGPTSLFAPQTVRGGYGGAQGAWAKLATHALQGAAGCTTDNHLTPSVARGRAAH